MGAFESRIEVNKKDLEKHFSWHMSDSLLDIYNDFLSDFASSKQDEKYKDDMHQVLNSKDGEEYYFDSYKYIYPITRNSEKSDMHVLNTNRGSSEVCKVSFDAEFPSPIIIENYDFNNKTATIQEAWLTAESRELFETNAGNFLLQISGNLKEYVDKLEKGPAITIKASNGKLVCFDEAGNSIMEQPASNKSFYSNCVDSFNYGEIFSNLMINKLNSNDNKEAYVDVMIDQMSQGIDVFGKNSNEIVQSNSKMMGYAAPWLIGLFTGAVSVGVILLGILLK